MNKPKIPCYKCQDRHGGCHAECERYAEYAKQQKAWRDTIGSAERGSTMAGVFLSDSRGKIKQKILKDKMRRGV